MRAGLALVVKDGPQSGKRFPIEGEVVIGREHADCVLDDEKVSRRHAVVRVSDGELVIEDCGSTNGTWVNGACIESAVVLRDADVISVGKTTFEVEGGLAATVISPEPSPVTRAQPSEPAPELHSGPAATGLAGPARARARPEPTAPFAPESSYSRRGIATRDIRVELLTIAAVMSTAVGLILYFGLR